MSVTVIPAIHIVNLGIQGLISYSRCYDAHASIETQVPFLLKGGARYVICLQHYRLRGTVK
jgi:hypothetical protein